jgi:Zn-finger protein
MEAKIIEKKLNSIIIQVEIPITNSMLTTEEEIQKALNGAGIEATSYALQQFDTDGTPLKIDGLRYTTKGQVSKIYQTPYGEVKILRHVYQNSFGGATFCPLENEARIIVGSTPKFAKMVSSKYSENASARVQVDLEENHGRYISRSYIQDISEAVSEVVQKKKESWEFAIPIEIQDVACIGISLDGTCMFLVGEGYRITMVGSISMYNNEGERLYTHYTASPPEYGKATFIDEFEKEIKKIQKIYPNAVSIGIADGAKDNWTFLEKHTTYQILDYFHATEYLSLSSEMRYKQKSDGKIWLEKACHKLKHEESGAVELLKELKGFLKNKITEAKKEKIKSAITYFENHQHQMNYKKYQDNKFPIGSGVIEAACKVIIKQRLCNSGMKWKDAGAKAVLCLRCINKSDGKWTQLWNKINRYGI